MLDKQKVHNSEEREQWDQVQLAKVKGKQQPLEVLRILFRQMNCRSTRHSTVEQNVQRLPVSTTLQRSWARRLAFYSISLE